jgi:hypothetical protein
MSADPRSSASDYVWEFLNETAPRYAREAIESGDLSASLEDWAWETAEGMAAVIYTGQAAALWAAGTFDEEDAELVGEVLADATADPLARMDRAVEVLSLEWHRRVLTEAAEEALRGLPCDHEGARCAAVDCPNPGREEEVTP